MLHFPRKTDAFSLVAALAVAVVDGQSVTTSGASWNVAHLLPPSAFCGSAKTMQFFVLRLDNCPVDAFDLRASDMEAVAIGALVCG